MWYKDCWNEYSYKVNVDYRIIANYSWKCRRTWKIIMVFLVWSKYLLTLLSFMILGVGMGVGVIPHKTGERSKEL